MNTTVYRASVLAASVAALAYQTCYASEYNVDAGHSHIGFEVRHMVSKAKGEFRDFEGSFAFDEKKPAASNVKFTVKSASINTNNEKRDEHLKSPDFFDVAKYPTLQFTSKKITSLGAKKYKLEGELTIHGVTKPVAFIAQYTGSQKDPWGNQRAGFSATTKINRKDFGIVWNKSLDEGGVVLGEDVSIDLDIEAIQKKDVAQN